MSVELLIFQIDDATIGVATSNVREVLRAAALFPLPEYPKFVEGGLNLRGKIIPVIDGRSLLSHKSKPISPNDHMIVVNANQTMLAIRVDRALELTMIEIADASSSTKDSKLMGEVVNTDRGPTSILNVDELANRFTSNATLLAPGSEP